jgi:hypothetical protein
MHDNGPHPPEHAGEGLGERSPEGQWLTYDELSRIRGIGRESAVKLVQRKRWRRIPGNDGVARVFVPPDWLTQAKEASGESLPEYSPEHSPRQTGLLAGALAALEDAVSALRERAEGAERRAELAEARTDRALTLLADVEAVLIKERDRSDRAETATAGERQRADALREWLDQMRVELEVAQHDARAGQQAAAELRQADAARRARGLVARLRAVWQGE